MDYGNRDYLEPAEETLITELGLGRLAAMDMLDMGVGGGRTTKYFAPLVRYYIGADYAPAMLKVCKKRFAGDFNFIECDARAMQGFNDNSFDFVLFSFNGIDSFSHKDRMAALKEVRRVLRDGGIFYFSSHNLNWIGLKGIFTIKNSIEKISASDGNQENENRNPLRHVHRGTKAAYRIFRLNLLNRTVDMKSFIDKLRRNEKGNIYDNSLNGKASIYYVAPKEQERQLKETGFIDIFTYSRSGIKTENDELLNQGGWVYYLCKVSKP
ncbi:MAG TPA: class I SAM-dependent methyltransferase [Candidatus Humimicrobiaceae bacterium]